MPLRLVMTGENDLSIPEIGYFWGPKVSLGELRGPARRLRGAITPSGEQADCALFPLKKDRLRPFSPLRHSAIRVLFQKKRRIPRFYAKKKAIPSFGGGRANYALFSRKMTNHAVRGAITRSVIPRGLKGGGPYRRGGIREPSAILEISPS